MKNGKSLVELATEIARQNESKRDFLIDTRQMVMDVFDSGDPSLQLLGTNIGAMAIGGITHRQIGNNLGISAKYYDKMLERNPELLADNVNAWFQNEPETRLIRTLDGRARAYLSDRYRRIDNYGILETVLPVVQEISEARVESCEVTERSMYLKIVNPRLETEVVPGDIVQAGIVISNSEVGHGSVAIAPLIFRLVCSNGMIVNDAGTRKYHIGRGNEADQNFELFSDATLLADDKAFMMKIQDTVRAVIDEVRFERVVTIMRDATNAKITSTDIPQVVELTGKEFGFSKEESGGILDHLIRDGEFSLYGLSNAVTRYSKDVESYDRATELESAGYGVLTMRRNMWNNINNAAA